MQGCTARGLVVSRIYYNKGLSARSPVAEGKLQYNVLYPDARYKLCLCCYSLCEEATHRPKKREETGRERENGIFPQNTSPPLSPPPMSALERTKQTPQMAPEKGQCAASSSIDRLCLPCWRRPLYSPSITKSLNHSHISDAVHSARRQWGPSAWTSRSVGPHWMAFSSGADSVVNVTCTSEAAGCGTGRGGSICT